VAGGAPGCDAGEGISWRWRVTLTGGAPLSVRERGREWRWAGVAELGQKRELGRGRKMGWVCFFLFFSNPFQIFFKPFLNSNLLHLFKFKIKHKFLQLF
jgi:hypothetical protein